VDSATLDQLLKDVQAGYLSIEEARQRLLHLPFENLGFAHVDHHRQLRQGFPEVIFAAGKSLEHLTAILGSLVKRASQILITRLDPAKAESLKEAFPTAHYHPVSQVMTFGLEEAINQGRGPILVISAGTSDVPVAEEACLTARIMGNEVEPIYDVGVAGLHRLLAYQNKFSEATVFIVVAGMEGALPSVVGGLVRRPVIAVPTSIGYGASFGGIAALLGMLNSCASGVSVVNIDNGFGAGYVAALINRKD
jgi:pyridinium-3,5-biscarboxylic acid mononucleotide synthase